MRSMQPRLTIQARPAASSMTISSAVRPDGKVRVAVREATPGLAGGQIVAVWPGFHDAAYGLAVDIGSTTIAATSSGETRCTKTWSSMNSRHSAAHVSGFSPHGQR